jgi:hypothetical protein
MTILTESISFEHGTYYRIGNRIVINVDIIPAGLKVKNETKKIVKNAFCNVFKEYKDGFSYEVIGWSNDYIS